MVEQRGGSFRRHTFPLLGSVGLLLLGACSAGPTPGSISMASAETLEQPLVFHAGVETASGSIDMANAYGLARLSTLAEDDAPADLADALRARGIDPDAGAMRVFDNSATQNVAFYVEAQGAAFVTFRGTDPADWQNLAEDADALATPDIVGQVHNGFLIATTAVWNDLADYIRARQSQNAQLPLYFTGHSLGAAMATIATAHALLDTGAGTIAVAALYTFGSPRVGDATFANGLASAMSAAGTFHTRVVYSCDPVTNVPFRPFYEHVSYGTNENDFVGWLASGTLLQAIPLDACAPVPIDHSIDQHMMPGYVSALGHLDR